MTDDLADEVVAGGKRAAILALQVCSGFFFSTGVHFNGHVVYKSTEERVDKNHMYIFHDADEAKWYCADSLWTDHKHRVAIDPLISVSFNEGVGDMPGAPCYPFWSDRAEYRVSITTCFEFATKTEMDYRALRESVDDADAAKVVKAAQAKGQHGGYMPKIAQIIAAYQKSDWKYVQKLINRFTDQSAALKDLVEDKMRR